MPLDNVTRLCGGKTRTGEPCRNPAMSNGRCYMHRGNAVIGIAHPNFKHGKFSTSLPSRMAAVYEETLKDPLIAESKRGIARMEARIEDLLSQVDHGESGELWEALTDAWSELGPAIYRERSGDGEHADRVRDTDNAVESIGLIISQGGSNFKLWQEIRDTEEQRRKCAESQTKREIAAFSLVNNDKLLALLGAVAAILKTYVRDTNDLAAASRRLHEVAVGTGSVN
jgi:hypothetical protein